jgi:hypothetical protein
MRIDSRLWTLWADLAGSLVAGSHRRPRLQRLVRRVPLSVLDRYERRHDRQLQADPRLLHHFERSVHSQNGEDGIIAEIFRRIGEGGRVFVEIGAADGHENCTAALAEAGWSGVWIEGDHQKVMDARAHVHDQRVAVVEAFVDRDSIVGLLGGASVPSHPDLLVIDIDGNDYWIWETVAERYAPRVVVIEYNAVVGPRWRWTAPYNADHRWDASARHGAGLAALVELGERLDYRLVGCDSFGVNAFFVRSDEALPFAEATRRQQWVPPRYLLPYGHPLKPFHPFDVAPLSAADGDRVTLLGFPPRRKVLRAGQTFYFDVEVTNGTGLSIGCSGAAPIQLAYWWIDERGARLTPEPDRCHQPWRADSGDAVVLVCRAVAPDHPGTYALAVGLVQEGVRWLGRTECTLGSWIVRGQER